VSAPSPTGVHPERGWHYRRSLASRVTLLTTMAVGLAVTMVALGAYATVRLQLQSSLDDSLTERAEQIASLSVQPGDYYGTSQLLLLTAADIRIAAVQSDGVVLAPEQDSRIRLGTPEVEVARGQTPRSVRTVRDTSGEYYRVVAVPTKNPGVAVALAQSLEPQQRLLGKLGLVTLLFGLAGMVIAGVAGWGVARNGLRPVRRLTAAAEDIAKTEQLAPIPVEGADEIARLASAFNQMLASLAASRDRQRRLVADAGHELRTPLTSMRTNIELLSQSDSTHHALPPEARAELMEDVQAQLEELTTLVGDLVELARDEPVTRTFESVELSEVLDQAVSRVRRRAPSVTFEVDADTWYVDGEGPALERALTNLLDNAAKWSPSGGTVRISLARGVVVVDDEGPGIAEADLPHVFERFYRADESRSMPGSGLGLSIVAQAAHRHGGTVEAGQAPGGGARLTFRVPGAPTPKPSAPPERQTEPDLVEG
jgi:two-component system sensor histidine kinase MprB